MESRAADETRIRIARVSDAAAIADVFRRSIAGLGGRDYAPAQVEAWLRNAPDAAALRRRLSDGRTTWIAEDAEGRALAFVDLEPDGHIDLLYALPEAAGTGVASRLYRALEAAARARGLRALHTEASEAARRFFLRRGFRELHRRELELQGVPIHNYAMQKTLGSS